AVEDQPALDAQQAVEARMQPEQQPLAQDGKYPQPPARPATPLRRVTARQHFPAQDHQGDGGGQVQVMRDAARDEALTQGGVQHLRADGDDHGGVEREAALPEGQGDQDQHAPNHHTSAMLPRKKPLSAGAAYLRSNSGVSMRAPLRLWLVMIESSTPVVRSVRSAGEGDLAFSSSFSMLLFSASKKSAPGGGGRVNRHEAGFVSPLIFAANTKSRRWPLRRRMVPLVPSLYSTRKAVGGTTGWPRTFMLPVFLRMSPGLTVSLRARAASSRSQLHL